MTPEQNTPVLLSFKLEIGRLIARRLFTDDPQLTAADIAPAVTRRLLEYDLTEAEAKAGSSETVNRMIDHIVAGVKADVALEKEAQSRAAWIATLPQEEPSSGDWRWDEIRKHLPPHMRNDPEVARHIGTLIGFGVGKTVVAVFGFLNRVLFGGGSNR